MSDIETTEGPAEINPKANLGSSGALVKKAQFWFLLLIFLLLLSTVLWSNLSIDLNLHDTYFVVSYLYAVVPPCFIFALVLVGYYWLGQRQLTINPVFKWLHIIVSYITTWVYLTHLFGLQIHMTSFTRRYWALSNVEAQTANTTLLIAFVLFFTFQLGFFGMMSWKLIKVSSSQR